ncbi:hypothetical protein [Niabella ginsengisoli]|uniref:Uncharacterized protein n=1 Tax=Niabella ginsengisoli TaxID=522298 RepID=A0ABS9SHW4_9BACT|nr:hypothetical protein [Niabella ginsengisoli]MCH5597958.1 hypothetical protein [Niabella ginsengisoli]
MLHDQHKIFELNVGAFIVDRLKCNNISVEWIENFLDSYDKISGHSSPPQLSIGVQILSGMVTHIAYDIATGKTFKQFPEFYYLSLK